MTHPPARPGVIPLRPLGLGEILDGAISTMRVRPALMLGVAAVVVAVSELLILAATYPLLDDLNRAATFDEATPPAEVLDALGTVMAVLGISVLITLLLRVFLSGFLTSVVGNAVLGRPGTFADVWTQVRPRLLPLLGLTMIYPLVAAGAAIVVFLLTVFSAPLGILALLGAIVVGIWLYVMFSLATPALVLEEAGVFRSFGRSRELVRGTWWRIFGILLLAGVITFLIAAIIMIPFNYFGDGFTTLTSTEPVVPGVGYLLLTTIGSIIAGTVTEPFAAAVTVLLYTDQRMRKEGLDIELARAAGVEPPPPGGPPQA